MASGAEASGAGKKRKHEETTIYEEISESQQPKHRPALRQTSASKQPLPIEAAVPKDVSHLLNHPPYIRPENVPLPLYTPKWVKYPPEVEKRLRAQQIHRLLWRWNYDPEFQLHAIAVSIYRKRLGVTSKPITPSPLATAQSADMQDASAEESIPEGPYIREWYWPDLSREGKPEGLRQDKAHYNAIHLLPQFHEGMAANQEDPDPSSMTSTLQAPVEHTVEAYVKAHSEPLAPVPAQDIQAMPPQRLMPWFQPEHIQPPIPPAPPLPRLITNDPRSPLNRNPLHDLPAKLSAVFPLPNPSLNRYQLPPLASLNPPWRIPAPNAAPVTAATQSQPQQQKQEPEQPKSWSHDRIIRPAPLTAMATTQDQQSAHDNLIRQINTYHNFGFSWDEIVEKLAKVGYGGWLDAGTVKALWESSQGSEDYHWTAGIGVKKECAEPGDFTKGVVQKFALTKD
ncbi:MAG: hypothetical protein LQ338_003492 [Usnochroma carphineum]|nr:MAG: hypothetical protein LQ338_003492 [Usnochroma carphineum]